MTFTWFPPMAMRPIDCVKTIGTNCYSVLMIAESHYWFRRPIKQFRKTIFFLGGLTYLLKNSELWLWVYNRFMWILFLHCLKCICPMTWNPYSYNIRLHLVAIRPLSVDCAKTKGNKSLFLVVVESCYWFWLPIIIFQNEISGWLTCWKILHFDFQFIVA